MSILDTSVSGMLANTNWLSTIAQNVANANTTGYKNVETDFQTLVDSGSEDLGASSSSSSEFAGVATKAIALNALQGTVQATSTTTDLAVQGTGYFVVSDSSGDVYLTRDGSFVPDSAGNLVNAAGYYLLGSPTSTSGVALNSLSGLQKINVADASDTSIPSTTATLVANLPSTSTAVTTPANLPSANSASSQFTAETSLVAYDDLGGAHTINFYFTNQGGNQWEVDAFDASTASAGGGFPYSAGPLATGTLNYSGTSGQLTSGSPFTFTVPGGQTLSVNLGQTTQLASSFAVSTATINGNAPGTLTSVSISQGGVLSFNYGNGSITPVYTIPLAKVAAPDNLTAVGGDAFQANYASGAPQVGVAGAGGFGSINSSSLEDSTVDIATELTDMVQAQASYEANSKVFQAGAKILDVLNDIQP
jgi:flagellar hook protein FlgE